MEAHTRETRAGNGGGARGARASTFLLGAVICAVVGLVSCRSTPPDGGETRPPPARRAWWNYYERGVQSAASGQWGEARRDFEVCLGVRDGAKYGYPRERWQARTYGVRFISDYFPHRELGICLLKLGHAQAAIQELEESLRQEPSGRAKCYLNQAVRAVQEGRDLAAPAISLDDVLPAFGYCRSHALLVSGEVTAEGRVGRLEVGGEPEFIELATARRPFSKEVRLSAGTNTIRIVAADLNGRVSETSVQRVADWRKPTWVVRSFSERGGVWAVECAVRDDFALRRVEVTRSGRPATQVREGIDVVALSLTCDPGERPLLEAVDEAGNALRVEVWDTLSREPKATAVQASRTFGFLGALRALPTGLLGASGLGSRLAWLASLQAAAGAPQDALKPTLRLETESECVRVYAQEYYVEGEAGDPGGLASVTVNGQEYLRPSDRGAVCATFGGRLPLDPGSNRFEVVAADVAGNRHARKLVVVRTEPAYREAQYRLAAGLPPFHPQGDAWAWQSRARLQKEFSRLPVRFRLLERDEGWDYILRELGLTVSELADPRTALRVGRMLSAELLFVGVILKQGDGLTVQLRAVDAAEGSVVLATDVYAESPERDLPYQLGGLFLKILQGFPVVEGRVIDIAGETVRIDVGAAQGVRVGSKFVVYRASAEEGATAEGALLSVADRPISLEVECAAADGCRTRIAPPEAAKLLQKGDCVYAR